jgi:hypothetical protein
VLVEVGRKLLPVKEVPVIGNWVGRLSRRVIVVFATTLVYKLVLFSPGLCRGKGGTNAHVKKSLGGIANTKDMKHQSRGTKKAQVLKGWK